MKTIQVESGSRNLPSEIPIQEMPAHTGGEGHVYMSCDGQHVVKVFHKPPLSKTELLRTVVRLGYCLAPVEERLLAWPLGVATQLDRRPCVGVITRRVKTPFQALVQMILPRAAQQCFRQGLSYLNLLKIARNCATGIANIHDKGMVHADIHYRNFLVDPKSAQVVVIDLDGLVVDGFLPPQVDGMMGFMAPEIILRKAKPNEFSDRHSLAVLILHILLLRNVMQPLYCYDEDDQQRSDMAGYGQYACFSENPVDQRNRPANLGVPFYRNGCLSFQSLTPRLQKLSERALLHGLRKPAVRPSAKEWEVALGEAMATAFKCPQCQQDFVYPTWLTPALRRRCPFCGHGVGKLSSCQKGVHASA
ncbi:MAG: protein kinase [Planctomycetota bacterium]